MTNICVIGGGPAGMYTSKYLLNSNYKVTMYEKNKPFSFFKKVISPFTSYTFNHFNDTMLNKNFEMILGKKVNVKDIERRYDAFVIATGASKPKKLEIPGYEHCTQALAIAKNYKNDKLEYRGDVLIVGCGNVAMDIVRYLFSKPKVNSITVLARKGPFAAAFSNAELRNVYDIKDIVISNNVDIELEYKKLNIKEGKDTRRKKILSTENIQKNQLPSAGVMKASNTEVEPNYANDKQNAIVDSQSCTDKQKLVATKEDEKVEGNNKSLQKESHKCIEAKENSRKILNMSFYSEIEQIIREGQKYTVDIAEKGKLQKMNFDMVISAIGFEKPKKILPISKPIFYAGWCKNPMGSLIDIKKDAFSVAQQITKFFTAK